MNYLQKVMSTYEESKHILTENYQQVLHSPSSSFRGMFWGYRQTAQFRGPIWIHTQTIQWDGQNNLALLFHGIPHPSPACACTVWLTYRLRNLFSSALTNRSHGSREWMENGYLWLSSWGPLPGRYPRMVVPSTEKAVYLIYGQNLEIPVSSTCPSA